VHLNQKIRVAQKARPNQEAGTRQKECLSQRCAQIKRCGTLDKGVSKIFRFSYFWLSSIDFRQVSHKLDNRQVFRNGVSLSVDSNKRFEQNERAVKKTKEKQESKDSKGN